MASHHPFWSSGQLLAGACGSAVSVWHASTGESETLAADGDVQSLRFTSNGRVLVLGTASGVVQLFSAGQSLGCLPNAHHHGQLRDMGRIASLRLSRSSTTLLVGSEKSELYIWDMKAQVRRHLCRRRAPRAARAARRDAHHLAAKAWRAGAQGGAPRAQSRDHLPGAGRRLLHGRQRKVRAQYTITQEGPG